MDDTVRVQSQLRELVAEEIRVLLVRRRMNGAKLAAAIGRSEMYVSRRLRGETAFDVDDLQRIAEVFGVPVVDLLPRSAARAPEGPTMTYPASRERTKRSRMRTPIATLMGHPGHRPADPEPTLPVATLTSCPTPTITRPAIVARRKSA